MNKNIDKLLRKKIETTMIGCLARFEESFGFLWGQNSENLSKQQEEFLNLWENVRESILDHGNSQIRKALSELKGNGPSNVKYSYYYKFNTRRNNDEN